MISIKAIRQELRDYCYSRKNEFLMIERLQDRSLFFYDITESFKSRHPRIKKKVLIEQVSKIYGVSSQTLYRSIAAQRAVIQGTLPKKYAARTANNIKNLIKTR